MGATPYSIQSCEPEAKYEALFYHARDGIVLLDGRSGVIVDCNPAFERLSGRPLSELRRLKIWELRKPSNVPAARALFAAVREKKALGPTETTFQTPDGETVHIEFVSRRILIDDKPYHLSIVRDISERKRTEAALKESEAKYRNLFETSQDAIFITTPEGAFLDLNEAGERLLGLPRHEILRRNVLDFYASPDTRARFKREMSQRGFVREFEVRIRRPDGTLRDCLSTASVRRSQDGKILAYQSILRDVTERKEAERSLRASEERYQNFFDQAPDMYFIVGPDARVKTVNRFGAEYLGYRKEELQGNSVWVVVHPEDLPRVQKQIKEIFTDKILTSELEFRKVRKDGSVLWVHERTQLTLDAEGEAAELLIICRDVSARKQAQQALQESESKFRALFEEARDGIVLACIQSGRVVDCNSAFEKMAGRRLAELRQVPLWELHPEKERHRAIALFREIREKGQGACSQLRFERPDGKLVDVDLVARKLAFEGEEYVQAIVRDSTEHKRTVEELRASRERLRALTGHLHAIIERERVSLARDVHDELGGALTALKIDLAVLERKLGRLNHGETEPLKREIEGMRKVIDQTVANVRKFVRQLRPEVLDSFGLIAALDWQLQEFSKRTGLACEFATVPEIEAADPCAEVDETCPIAVFRIFQEALTNIARHAQATRVRVAIRQQEDTFVVEIRDNGVGIPKEKLNGGDTFGLLGMKERALLFGGQVQIKSRVGQGTTVKIQVPLKRLDHAAPTPSPES